MERKKTGDLPEGHFLAEIHPDVRSAVDAALKLAEAGKTTQALHAMENLAGTHPRNHNVCYGMGTVHSVSGSQQEALVWFKKAVKIFPYFPEAYFHMGASYIKLSDMGNMIRAYRKATV